MGEKGDTIVEISCPQLWTSGNESLDQIAVFMLYSSVFHLPRFYELNLFGIFDFTFRTRRGEISL
jgi:hypothetical protein